MGCLSRPFEDGSKFFLFYFLSHDVAAVLSTFLITGVCVGSYYLNTMLNDELSTFIVRGSRIFGIFVLTALGIYLIGILLRKKLLLMSQITISFALYIFFSFACFSCNLITLIFGDAYRKNYNIYNIFTEYYFIDHEDSKETFDDVKKRIKLKLYMEAFLHIITFIVMIYYYFVTRSYVERVQRHGKEDYITGNKFVSGNNSRFGSTSKYTNNMYSKAGSSNNASSNY